jgi:signal transduction histidine kinase
MIRRMRLLLALSALLVVYIDPSEPDRFVVATYTALVVYSIYSAALVLLSLRPGAAFHISRASHWIDVGWYLLLVALSNGTSSIFFVCFFFAILVASFRWGAAEGVRVTLASALFFTLVGYLTAPAGQAFELNRFLLRPVYLLLLGYMMAFWGGFEIKLKRRLALLKAVNTFSNPRFGTGQTIISMMKRVRAFYKADACLLILSTSKGEGFRLTRVERTSEEEAAAQSESIPVEVAAQFLSLPETLAVVYNVRRRFWQPREDCFYAFDLARQAETDEGRETSDRLSVALEAEAFISLPLRYREQTVGRVYLTGRRGIFGRSDVGFLLQIVEHVIPVLDNIRLLDRLASDAAERERQRIARDIHDSVIQPYIGLQYKVAAIRNKMQSGDGGDVSAELEKLFEVTAGEITGLRRYVRGLKEESSARDDLLSAVRRYVEQFEDNYAIRVRVESRGELNVNDRLAAELIQIVHEGLSNVRKHTEATSALVSFECRDGKIILSVENDNPSGASFEPFVPRSITERTENLGGRVRIERLKTGSTAVRVEIPL